MKGLRRGEQRAPGESDLEALVAADERGELRERLLARAADADEERVPARHADDARDLHDVRHGVLEEYEVEAAAADRLVVLILEELEPLLEAVERRNRLVHLRHLELEVLGLVAGGLRGVAISYHVQWTSTLYMSSEVNTQYIT